MDQAKQDVLNAIPETGEIEYNDLRIALITANKLGAVKQINHMRRAGEVAHRLEVQPDKKSVKLFISRPTE